MPMYMTQFAYTAEAWTTLAKNPQDRTEAVSGLAKKMGGRLVSLHYCFGEYDGVLVTEVPDDVSATALAIAAVTGGHVRTTRTTRLMTAAEAMEAMRKAGAAGYQGPKK
jgi:uncharacterized protein with GYD domain